MSSIESRMWSVSSVVVEWLLNVSELLVDSVNPRFDFVAATGQFKLPLTVNTNKSNQPLVSAQEIVNVQLDTEDRTDGEKTVLRPPGGRPRGGEEGRAPSQRDVGCGWEVLPTHGFGNTKDAIDRPNPRDNTWMP